MDDAILEPLDLYHNKFKELHNENSKKFFDELTLKSNINIEQNKETVKKLNLETAIATKASKRKSKFKRIKVLLIILSIISILVTICFPFQYITTLVDSLSEYRTIEVNLVGAIICFVLGLACSITFILLIVKKVNPNIKEASQNQAKHEEKSKELVNEATEQMAPLNELFDWNLPAKIIPMTTPLIQLDEVFDASKLIYLCEKYGYRELSEKNISALMVQSGSIVGNPFLILKTVTQKFESKTYTGSLYITWTTLEKDSKGNVYTKYHSQTLYASLTKPVPVYEDETRLVYGNEAAPNTTFSRSPSYTTYMNEKQVEKHVKKGENKLEKKARKSIEEGKSFTKLANSDFEVLFGATDRNNELEFRLLFTPLAQKNMIKVIRTKDPYGDDFYFYKNNKINTIISNHSQRMDYMINPAEYESYNYEETRNRFINYSNNYFKSLYFDLVPLLSIPAYQQTKPVEYIYEREYSANYSSYEHESMANSFKEEDFAHPESNTHTILKTKIIEKNLEADKVLVTAHSFKAVLMTSYIPVRGGDGCMHSVPVDWYDYIPLERETLMEMKYHDISRKDFFNLDKNEKVMNFLSNYALDGDIMYKKRILAFILTKNIGDNEIQNLKEYLNKGEN